MLTGVVHLTYGALLSPLLVGKVGHISKFVVACAFPLLIDASSINFLSLVVLFSFVPALSNGTIPTPPITRDFGVTALIIFEFLPSMDLLSSSYSCFEAFDGRPRALPIPVGAS